MKRKIKCGTCETTKNSATGEPLYILGQGAFMTTFSPIGECWDCGESRRAKEEVRRQKFLSRLFTDDRV